MCLSVCLFEGCGSLKCSGSLFPGLDLVRMFSFSFFSYFFPLSPSSQPSPAVNGFGASDKIVYGHFITCRIHVPSNLVFDY